MVLLNGQWCWYQGGGVAIIKVKRTKDDVSRASILKALEVPKLNPKLNPKL